MGRRVILAVSFGVAAMSLTACDDAEPASGTADASTTSGVPASTGASVSSTTNTTAEQGVIAKWIDRTAGQTIAYRMDLRCFCAVGGSWSVVERDGVALQAQYLGDGEAGLPAPEVLMTEGLPFAVRATGPVSVSETATTLRLSADVDIDGIDDEFSFEITDFRTLPNYPEGAPSGPGTNYHLVGQLVAARPAGSDQQPVDGAVRAVNPLDGTIVTYAATNPDDTTFSLYVPEGTYRILGRTAERQSDEFTCTHDDVTVPSPDATRLVVSCPQE